MKRHIEHIAVFIFDIGSVLDGVIVSHQAPGCDIEFAHPGKAISYIEDQLAVIRWLLIFIGGGVPLFNPIAGIDPQLHLADLLEMSE